MLSGVRVFFVPVKWFGSAWLHEVHMHGVKIHAVRQIEFAPGTSRRTKKRWGDWMDGGKLDNNFRQEILRFINQVENLKE